MGGIPGAPGAGVIDWRFTLESVSFGDVRRLVRPVVLVLREEDVAALPLLTAAQLVDSAASGAPGVLRRQLLAALAARALGLPPADVRLTIDPRGRRMLGSGGVYASVAYRPGWVAAALALAPVGVDIETAAEAEAAGPVALESFAGDDTALASRHGPAGIWATKEASLKSRGRSLGSAPLLSPFPGSKIEIIALGQAHGLRCEAVAAVAFGEPASPLTLPSVWLGMRA